MGETRVTQADKHSLDRILYLVPAFPAVSETFVYREISALQARGKTISLCALYEGDDKNVSTPDLDSVTILYKSGIAKHIGSLGAMKLKHPIAAAKTIAMFMGDFLKAGIVTRHARALVYQFLAAATLARDLRKNDIQHIHAHFAHSPTQVAMYAARFAGIGFSFTGHANDIYERGFMLRQKAERATQMVTISDFNQRYLTGLGVPADKLSVIRAILRFPRQSPTLRQGETLRLGSLGRLVGKKGMDTTLAALALLDDAELSRITLEIGGDGPQREMLKDMAKPLRERGATISFLGQVNPEGISAWMENLDAFVLACRQTKDGDVDGIPVVLMEAIATGIPVISTSISGVPELITHNVGGLIGEPDNAESIATHIRHLLNEPQTAFDMANAAQTHLFDEFDPDKNIDRLLTNAFGEGLKT